MACMPRPTTRLQTGRSWTGCSTSVKRQSRAQSRFVRQALRIASTRTRALGGSSPDFAICASSPKGPACVALGAARKNSMSPTKQEKNKALVLEAFDTLFNKRDYVAAERYWSPHYIQHS